MNGNMNEFSQVSTRISAKWLQELIKKLLKQKLLLKDKVVQISHYMARLEVEITDKVECDSGLHLKNG